MHHPRIDVTAITHVGPKQREALPLLLQDLHRQVDVNWELIVLDTSLEGDLECDGATVLHAPQVTQAARERVALAHAQGRYIAWVQAECPSHPQRFAQQAATLDQDASIALVTTGFQAVGVQGQRVDICVPHQANGTPVPGWDATAMWRPTGLVQLPETAFSPVALRLYATLKSAQTVTHIPQPLIYMAADTFGVRKERQAADLQLLAHAAHPTGQATPEFSVLICTYNRKPILEECLEAFCRQQMPRGSYELVVVDDGSKDGTHERFGDLEWPIPVTWIHQENTGLAGARNTGLARCRGRLVHFVNDDTIPFPDCVQRHIEAHDAMPERQLAVLGTFEQPESALNNALMRHLEQTDLVFQYTTLDEESFYDCMKFWTCNVSVPLSAVRQAGNFNADFSFYGCEDTDLGYRLEKLGVQVVYRANARAYHRHILTFDDFKRRQTTVARAFVRFFSLHPETMARWNGVATVDQSDCEDIIRNAVSSQEFQDWETSARQLSALDLSTMERCSESGRAVARNNLELLGRLIEVLNQIWWRQGYAQGFEEMGITGFPELWQRVA